MLNKILGVIDSARRAFGAEQKQIREGLKGLELTDTALADRAADFVATGNDAAVLLDLAAQRGAPGAALGSPGNIGWHFNQHAANISKTAKASRAARNALYQRVSNTPEYVALLVRLGKVLEAADQLQQLDRTSNTIPDWLQYLLNDALWGSYGDGVERTAAARPAWDVNLVAALLADDGYHQAMVLPVVFERRDLNSYFQSQVYQQLLAAGPLDQYLLDHPADVNALAATLSAPSRVTLTERLGSNPALLQGFAGLLVKLAVGDSKTVRTAAACFIDAIDPAQANALLGEILRQGQTDERANAVELLARTQGAGAVPLLSAALETETSKPVQQSIRNALVRLQATDNANALEMPEPPPLPPPPQQVLGDDAIELLLKNREELLERYRKNAEAEIANNQTAKYQYKYQQEHYKRYRQLGENSLRLAIQGMNGEGGATAKGALSSAEVDATLALGGRLEARPDFGLPQLLRWIISSRRNYWGIWQHAYFQAWLNRQDKQQVDLRQLATLVEQYGGDAESLLRNALREQGGHNLTPQQVLPPQRVWPLFAAHPELIDEGLGLAPASHDAERHGAPHLSGTLSVLATFPVIPARWIPRLLELALGEGKTHRAAAQQVLAHLPDIGKLVCESLKSSKQELRIEAARWLVTLDYRAGIPALEAALAKESRETVSATLMTALEQLGVDIAPHLAPARLLAQAQKGLKGKPPAGMAWLSLDGVPACTWLDGTPVAPEIIRWWIILAVKLKEPAGNALLERYLGLLATPGRAALGGWVLHQFIAQDTRNPALEDCVAYAQAEAPSRHQSYQDLAKRYPEYYGEQGKMTLEQVFEVAKREKMSEYLGTAINEKGLLALISGLPGHEIVAAIQSYMRDHYQRRAQVEALMEAACVSNDASVIQFALGIARRYRTASVQEKARLLVQRIAERNGWTQDQLADRTVPSGGLDDSGTLTLHYGSRQFSVTLDAALKPVLRNEDGKTVSALPAARQDDAAEAIKEAKQLFTTCKKEVKQVVEMQTSRLYEAMCVGRVWPVAEWRSYLQQHPVVGRLVQQLVWQELDGDGAAVRLFRPTEDGSLIDASDDEVALDAQFSVRLAHRALLADDVAAAWSAHFKDYKLKPLFEQMTRALPASLGGDAVDDRVGWISDTFTLRGAFNKRGYQRGAAEDGGIFFEYTKEFASAGLTVVMEFSGSQLPEENLPAALKTLFFRGRDGNHYNYRALALEQIPPVLLAEAYGDYHTVAAACTGYDAEWEQKMPW